MMMRMMEGKMKWMSAVAFLFVVLIDVVFGQGADVLAVYDRSYTIGVRELMTVSVLCLGIASVVSRRVSRAVAQRVSNGLMAIVMLTFVAFFGQGVKVSDLCL